jgi:hypothetical protein
MRLVRNTRTSERWGEEEAVVPFKLPLRRGEAFYMYIFVAESKFLVAIDGRHMCSYPVRAKHLAGKIISQIKNFSILPVSNTTGKNKWFARGGRREVVPTRAPTERDRVPDAVVRDRCRLFAHSNAVLPC